MSFAMPKGVSLEQMLRLMSKTSAAAKAVSELVEEVTPESKPTKRARIIGRFKADDPATPQNEAWSES